MLADPLAGGWHYFCRVIARQTKKKAEFVGG